MRERQTDRLTDRQSKRGGQESSGGSDGEREKVRGTKRDRH